MSTMKIKKGDMVKVIAGKDKDKEGKVLPLTIKTKVVVEGVNMLTKHTKPSHAESAGGIVIRKVTSMHLTLCIFTKEKQQELDSSGWRQKSSCCKSKRATGEVID